MSSSNSQSILALDLNTYGHKHEQFNLSFIAVLRQTFPAANITFLADQEHLTLLQNKMNHGDIQYSSIATLRKTGHIFELLKAIKAYFLFLQVLSKRLTLQDEYIFVLYMHPFTQFLFRVFPFCKSKHIHLVLHGELEALKFNKTILNKFWGHLLKYTLVNKSPAITYIILGHSIYTTLLKYIPGFSNTKSIIIDHPYPFEKVVKLPKSKTELIFSLAGTVSVQKNAHLFYEIASKIRSKYKHCSFLVSGTLSQDMKQNLNNDVLAKQMGEAFTREEINTILNAADFIVFYYDNTNYSLCASGSFWDCINAETPILFVKNDYFSYYEQIAGKLGVAFDSANDLNNYMFELAQNGLNIEEYQLYISNIKKLKSKLASIQAIAEKLTSQLDANK